MEDPGEGSALKRASGQGGWREMSREGGSVAGHRVGEIAAAAVGAVCIQQHSSPLTFGKE